VTAATGGFGVAIVAGFATAGFSASGGGMTAALGERLSPAGFGDGPVSRPRPVGGDSGLAAAFSRAGDAASFLTTSTT
jgi:hypothetical protein